MTDPQSGPVTVDEPERTNNPAEIGSSEVPSEGVAVPDGGDLTNEPNRATPDSPARPF
jgi:hypothetical protein